MEHLYPDYPPSHNAYSRGCRCDECRVEHSEYAKHKQRARRRPDSGWDNPLVSASKVKKHLKSLISEGMEIGRVSTLSGVNRNKLYAIMKDDSARVLKNTERRILAITSDPDYVDATEVREHLLWLQTRGVGIIQIANSTGIPKATVSHIRLGRIKRINREYANKLLACGTHRFRRDIRAIRASESRLGLSNN